MLKVGDTFNSFEEFSKCLKAYSDEKCVCFYKREARTIAAAKKKTSRFLKADLKYYQLRYTCIKGGKEFKTNSKGKRICSTYRNGCNAHISLRASKCGTKLQIRSISDAHNHEVSQKLYNHLPQQRRLPEDLKSEIIQMARVKANKKHLKSFIEEKCNKVVLLKDVHNITNSIRIDDGKCNDLTQCAQKIQEKYRADCHVLSSENKDFKALFFQTHHMKHYMAAYPEFICLDSTYKLLNIRSPIIIVVNEDGNGLTEIIAVAILVEETSETMQWFFSTFKDNNPNWPQIKSIMADKDLNERRLLQSNFPNANVLICIFHVLRTFKREISTSKLGITLGQRQTALEILQKMVYSRDSNSYDFLYGDLIKSCPASIVEYFNKNWHPIKDEWCLGEKFQESNFLKTTNNRLESLNSKIKSIFERYSTLSKFIDDFFQLILIMNEERDRKAADLIYKNPVTFYDPNSVLGNYFNFLTNYAFEFVKQQYESRNVVSVSNDDETSILSCTCASHASMLLPCGHIFKKREESGVSLFDDSLCNVRWSRQHYYQNQRLFLPAGNEPETSETQLILSHTQSKEQKFNKAWSVLKSLASLISEEESERYHCKLKQLILLKKAWENNKDVDVIESRLNASEMVEIKNEFVDVIESGLNASEEMMEQEIKNEFVSFENFTENSSNTVIKMEAIFNDVPNLLSLTTAAEQEESTQLDNCSGTGRRD